MPSGKGSLRRSPLGQPPGNYSLYEKGFDLVSTSDDDSEQFQARDVPRYASWNLGDFKFKTPTSVSTKKGQPTDPEALTMENSHGFDLTDMDYADGWSSPVELATPKQSLRMQRLEEIEETGYSYLRQKRRCSRQCRCILVIIFCILFSVAVVLGSLFVATKPKPPMLGIEGVNFTRFEYKQGVNGGHPQVAAGLRFVVKVANPNKEAELIYDQVTIELKYQDSLLGNISIPGFEQFKKNKRDFAVELPETLTAIQDPLDALKFLEEFSSFNVQTDLRGAVGGHYKMWGIRFWKFEMPVDCRLNVKPETGGLPAHLISSSCYHYLT